MIRVLHLITTLETGGAEMFLYRLLSGLDKKRFQSRVVSIRRRGPVDELIKELGIPVTYLDMKPAFPNPLGLLRFRNELRSFRPHVLQTWLYHADLLGLSARLAGVRNILWNIRCSDMDFSRYNPMTRWIVRACAKLSHVPRAVLANSESGRDWHLRLGYNPREFIVIPNGYDMRAFEPDLGARTALREELDITPEMPLIGLAGRFDPMKGHEQFIQAAALVLQQHPEARFLLCGEGVDADNSALVDWIKKNQSRARVFSSGTSRRYGPGLLRMGYRVFVVPVRRGICQHHCRTHGLRCSRGRHGCGRCAASGSRYGKAGASRRQQGAGSGALRADPPASGGA